MFHLEPARSVTTVYPRKRLAEQLGLVDSVAEEQQRFMNRIKQSILEHLPRNRNATQFYRHLCFLLGVDFGTVYGKWAHGRFNDMSGIELPEYAELSGRNWLGTLNLLAAIHEALPAQEVPRQLGRNRLGQLVQSALDHATVDLGVRWHEGTFYQSGDPQLDEALLERGLDTLRGFHDEQKDFAAALKALIEKRDADALRDCYTAIEGLAKRVTGRDVSLDKNKELLLSKLELRPEWKSIVGDFLKFVNVPRHANEGRNKLSAHEAEACVYMTGLLIRLITRSRTFETGEG